MKTFLDWLLEASMTPAQAMEVFGISQPPTTEKELNALWKKLAMSRHPDHGGSTKMMQELNAAKDILKKGLGIPTSSKARKDADTLAKHKECKEFIANEMSKLFLKLDEKKYAKWFESIFKKPFSVEVNRGTTSDGYGSVPVPYVELKAFSEANAEVFTMKLVAGLFGATSQMGGLGSDNATFDYYVTTDALVGGKRQVIAKSISAKKNNMDALKKPETVFPKARMEKLAAGLVRKDSKLKKSDFETMLRLRWGCESDGKSWWGYAFDEKDGIAKALGLQRFVVKRMPFWQFGMWLWQKDSSKKYGVWKESREVAIDCSFMPETKETADFIESVLAYAKKIKDPKKIAEFIKKGSKQLEAD